MRSFRPVRPRREALPGLLVMVLIAITGVILARGLSDLIPEELFETSPFAGLTAEEVEIDPATGLPIVPLPERQIVTWSVVEPNSPVEPANTWTSDDPGGVPEPGQRTVSLLATYPSHEAAVTVAMELAQAVGDPVAEAAWLSGAGVDPGAGFEWVGPEGSATPFVQVVDRRLLVDGLRWDEAFEPEPPATAQPGADLEAAGSADPAALGAEPGDLAGPVAEPRYGAPLALALEASAASMLVEGDRGGEGVIAFDLVCIGDADALLTLEQRLADLDDTTAMRAPWLDPPLTLDEERARRTARMASELRASAFIGDLLRAADLQPLTVELERALEADDREAIAAAEAAIEARLAEVVPDRLEDLGPLAQAIDPDALATSLARSSISAVGPVDEVPGEEAAASEPALGAASVGGNASFQVDAEGRRLWITQGTWSGITEGYGPFVEHLAANGCDDIRVVFHDLDDVRRD